ncbi:hypothetical protein J6590_016334 [Homalodisca vitripennis]|nr:hypothetical protein J6590_016334 [Homalodisca vitripennis]
MESTEVTTTRVFRAKTSMTATITILQIIIASQIAQIHSWRPRYIVVQEATLVYDNIGRIESTEVTTTRVFRAKTSMTATITILQIIIASQIAQIHSWRPRYIVVREATLVYDNIVVSRIIIASQIAQIHSWRPRYIVVREATLVYDNIGRIRSTEVTTTRVFRAKTSMTATITILQIIIASQIAQIHSWRPRYIVVRKATLVYDNIGRIESTVVTTTRVFRAKTSMTATITILQIIIAFQIAQIHSWRPRYIVVREATSCMTTSVVSGVQK